MTFSPTDTSPALLMGAHFRPPAKLILEHLQGGTELYLLPEPTNPYDENAIKVCLATENLPTSADFSDALAGFGHSLESLHGEAFLHLGYIEKGRTADYKNISIVYLGWNSLGKPTVSGAAP